MSESKSQLLSHIKSISAAKSENERNTRIQFLLRYIHSHVVVLEDSYPKEYFEGAQGKPIRFQSALSELSSLVRELAVHINGSNPEVSDISRNALRFFLADLCKSQPLRNLSVLLDADYDSGKTAELLDVFSASMRILIPFSRFCGAEAGPLNLTLQKMLEFLQRNNVCHHAIRAGSGERLSRCVQGVIDCLKFSFDPSVKDASIDVLVLVLNLSDQMHFTNSALGPLIRLLGEQNGAPPLPLWCQIEHRSPEHNGSRRLVQNSPSLFDRVLGLCILFDCKCPIHGSSSVSGSFRRSGSLFPNSASGLAKKIPAR